jgi:transposase
MRETVRKTFKEKRRPTPAQERALYEAVHSHVLQDVLARLDKTYQAFFRRVQRGEKAGFPRFKGRNRFHSFTFTEYGNQRVWQRRAAGQRLLGPREDRAHQCALVASE